MKVAASRRARKLAMNGPAFGVALFFALDAFAATYSVNRSVIGASGAVLQGGHFTITGSIGQPLSGRESTGPFSANNGFWAGGNSVSDVVFADGFEGQGTR